MCINGIVCSQRTSKDMITVPLVVLALHSGTVYTMRLAAIYGDAAITSCVDIIIIATAIIIIADRMLLLFLLACLQLTHPG